MRTPLIILLAAMGIITLHGCKTNEKNMSDAYNAAIAVRNGDDPGLDSTIYTKVRRDMKQGSATIDGKEVPINSQWVRVTDGGGGIRESLKRFNVVVGQFKLEFNAKSMRERLIGDGYPGAFVVQTAEPYYFVVAASFDDAKEAAAMLEKAQDDARLKMKAPLPFILEPPQFRR